jgi:hypothetical protein
MRLVDPFSRRLATGAIGLLTLGALMSPCWADSLDKRLAGGWVTSQDDCKKIFERRGGKIQFRRPVDEFKASVVIDATRINGPVDQCSIKSISTQKEVTRVALYCHNTIGYFDRNIQIKIVSPTQIINGFPDNDALDVTFQKCPL